MQILPFFLALALVIVPLAAEAGSYCSADRQNTRFCRADTNHDDRLSSDEFAAGFRDMTKEAFGMLDKDGSGAIESSEWESFLGAHAAGMTGKGGAMPGMSKAPDGNGKDNESKPALILPPDQGTQKN